MTGTTTASAASASAAGASASSHDLERLAASLLQRPAQADDVADSLAAAASLPANESPLLSLLDCLQQKQLAASQQQQLQLCESFAAWAERRQLAALRICLLARRMALLCAAGSFGEGLQLATQLLAECRQMDERQQAAAVSQLEDCVLRVSRLAASQEVAQFMLRFIPEFSQQLSKVKVAKLVKLVLDNQQRRGDAGTGAEEEMQLCNEFIQWADSQKFSYLRQSLQVRLMGLLYETGKYEEALRLGSRLLRELKKLDDKMLLVEVQLMESKTYYKLGNVQRSRAALTSSRTTANGIYIPPKMQANLDLQSGILHAADERDFKTAYSYFYESFEGYDSVDYDRQAVNALKYMLMCKVILNLTDEVSSILSGKLALKYASYRDVQAMTEIAGSVKRRSLADFVAARQAFKAELDDDFVVQRHLAALYDSLVERNLSKLIEPYSRVQISHIADLISLPQDVVEKKMSQMILDKSLNGILDQETGVLVMYSSQHTDDTYLRALDTIHEMSKVIDQLYVKSRKLN